MLGQVKAPVQRCQHWPDGREGHWIGEIVQVTVHDIELLDALPEMAECDSPIRGKVLGPRRLVPERLAHGGDKPSRGPRVSGSEQRGVVAATDQFFGQRADNSLRTTVAGGRHTLEWWRDLGDSHARFLFGLPQHIARAGCFETLSKARRTSATSSSMSNGFCTHPEAPRVAQSPTRFA